MLSQTVYKGLTVQGGGWRTCMSPVPFNLASLTLATSGHILETPTSMSHLPPLMHSQHTSGTDHLSEWRSERNRVRGHSSPTSLPRIRRSRKGHHTIYQLPRRVRHGRVGNLRHNDLHKLACIYGLRGTSCVDGFVTPLRRTSWEAILSTT